MGWYRPPRQTAGDFLTAVTNPQERQVREGMEDRVPRTADDFAGYWKKSPQYEALKQEIAEYREQFPPGGQQEVDFGEVKRFRQAKHVRPKSPYVISIPMQVRLCTIRAYQRYVCLSFSIANLDYADRARIWNDKPSTLTTLIGRIVMSLIIGSIYYG